MPESKFSKLSVGVLAGITGMYFLDPHTGKRRRARVKDGFAHMRHVGARGLDVGRRDLAYRAEGLLARGRNRLKGERPVDDAIVVERVRSKLGRYVSHPHAIEVRCQNGKCVLKGPILAHEQRGLVDALAKVKGVHSLENRLEAHRASEDFPALQGGTPRAGERMEILQTNWSPGTRLLVSAGSLSLGLLSAALARRNRGAGLALGAGAVLGFSRAVSNLEVRRFLGFKSRQGVTLHKTISFDAPIEKVYEFGKAIRRDVEISFAIPNRILAWKSKPGSPIRHAGVAKFVKLDDQSTKVELDMTYNPFGGYLGHALLKLFGSDPKKRIEWAMVQMKQALA